MTFELDPSAVSEDSPAALLALAAELGLVVSLTSTLRSYPGSVHWHFAKPCEKGTLELTWWPRRQKLWLKVHPGRQAEWVGRAVERFVEEFGGSV